MIVAGIDPGTATCAISIVDVSKRRPLILDSVGYRATNERKKRGAPVDELADVSRMVRDVLDKWIPALVACEGQFGALMGSNKAGVTNAASFKVLTLVGMIQEMCSVRCLRFVEVHPLRIKSAACVSGSIARSESKRRVKAAAHRMFDLAEGVKLNSSHKADSCFAAVVGWRLERVRI